MDKDQQEQKEFLEQQLQWSRNQVRIWDAINVKLHEMREIAEYALENELTQDEIEKLNAQLNVLKGVIYSLKRRLHSVIH